MPGMPVTCKQGEETLGELVFDTSSLGDPTPGVIEDELEEKLTESFSQKSSACTEVKESPPLSDRWSLAWGVVMIGRSRRRRASTSSSKSDFCQLILL